MSAEIARARDELRARFPRWCVWYGEWSGSWWALPCWLGAADQLVEARTPAELAERMRSIEHHQVWGAGRSGRGRDSG